MEVERRIRLCRIVEKVDKNKRFAEKLGTENKSKFEKPKEGYKC